MVVDPRRDIENLADAREHDLTIEGSSSPTSTPTSCRATSSSPRDRRLIGYGDRAQPEFDFRPLHDGERISLGDVTLQIMTTPATRPSRSGVLVFEHADDATPTVSSPETPCSSATSDAPTCWRPSASQAELASQLYDSIQHKLMGSRTPSAYRRTAPARVR